MRVGDAHRPASLDRVARAHDSRRMPETMRSAIARGPGRVVLEEAPLPQPEAGQVLLRVRRCGICGSDLHWYHGRHPAPAVCPGHEISAVVADVGAGVRGVKAGDRVAVEGLWGCGTCGP